MAYTYTWTPRSALPTNRAQILVRTWDGKSVPGASYTTSARQITVTVPQKGRYSLFIRSGPDSEAALVDIPAVSSSASIQERVSDLESGGAGGGFDPQDVATALGVNKVAIVVTSSTAPTATTYTAPNGYTYDILWTAVPAPDTTAPTAGTLAVSASSSSADLSISGATDDSGKLSPTPYSFTRDNGVTWSAWQAGTTYQYTGLTASTSYTFQHRVQDAAGNISTGTAITKSTTAVSTLTTVLHDTFTRADGALATVGAVADTGQTWLGSTATAKIATNKLQPASSVIHIPHGVVSPAEGTATVTVPTAGSTQISFRAPATTTLDGSLVNLTDSGLLSFGGTNVLPTTTFNNNNGTEADGSLKYYTPIPGFVAGGTYEVRMTWTTSTVTVYVGSTRLLEGTYSAAQLTTLEGYTSTQIVGNDTTRVDNVKVAS